MDNAIKPFDLKNFFCTMVLSVLLIGPMYAAAHAFISDSEKACMEKVANVSFMMRTGALSKCIIDDANQKSQKYEINRHS